MQASTFEAPKLAPKPAPKQLTNGTPAPVHAKAPAAIQVSKPTPTAPTQIQTKLRNVMLYHGKCKVAMHQGQTVVPDANFCVSVSAENDTACFMLTATGKPGICIHVLELESPIMHGTSCIARTKPKPGKETPVQEYAVTPEPPLTAERLAKTLEYIQFSLEQELRLKGLMNKLPVVPSEQHHIPASKPAPVLVPVSASKPPPPRPVPVLVPVSAPTVPDPLPASLAPDPLPEPVQPVPQPASARPGRRNESLILHSPHAASPELAPARAQNELVEFTTKKQQGKPTVVLNDVIDDITVIVRNAYRQVTGSSTIPMVASLTDQPGDVASAEWLKKGHLDSEADDTRRGLLEIMRLLNALRLKPRPTREPLMSSQTMEVFKVLDRGLRNQGSSISYSATELMQLRKGAIVPPEMTRRGLGNSMWAKK